MAEKTNIDDVRMLVEIACKHGAPIDVVFELDGDVRVSIYPPERVVINAVDTSSTKAN